MIYPTNMKNAPRVALNVLKPKYLHQLLEPMEFHINYSEHDLRNGFHFDIKIRDRSRNKINPTLRLAHPGDAQTIVDIVKEDYESTYPYKEMEDVAGVSRKIESGRYKFIVFLNKQGEVIGTTCFVLHFNQQTGYTRTFVVKKKWLGILDATKAYVASFATICNRYKNKIHLWWGEMRTADAKSQYINRLCSFRPLGFLPNKDYFYNRIESDILVASYNREMFTHHRSQKQPNIIPEVSKCYSFSKLQYDLGRAIIQDPKTNFRIVSTNAKRLKNDLMISQHTDKYNYITYKLQLKGTTSHFSFLYTPRVNNFEKVEYNVDSIAELELFVKTYRKIGQKLGVRYMEAYVPAYKPSHQNIFNKLGFTPRGYLPAWRYNKKTNKFEDYVLFNWYRGPLVDCEMIPEGSSLLQRLDLDTT